MISLEKYFPVDLDNPINKFHRLANGITAWYLSAPQLIGGRTWYDILNLHNAVTTVNGFPNWVSSTRPGGFGGGLKGDNVANTQRLSLSPTISFPSSLGFGTVAFWIKPESSLLSYGAIFTAGSNVGLYFRSTGKLDWFQSGDHIFSTVLSAGVWNHCVFVISPIGVTNSLNVYINGILDATGFTSLPQSVFNIDSIFSDVANEKLNATLDDFIVWNNRALTATEAFGLYILSKAGHPGLLNRVNFLGNPALIAFIAYLNQRVLKGSVITPEDEEEFHSLLGIF